MGTSRVWHERCSMSRRIEINSFRLQGDVSLSSDELRQAALGYLSAIVAKSYGQGDGPEPRGVPVRWDLRQDAQWYLEHIGVTGVEATCLLAREVVSADDFEEIEAFAVQIGLTPGSSYIIEPHMARTKGAIEGDAGVKLYGAMLGVITRRWSDDLVLD